MGDNTRLLYYLMQFVEENNITGLLLLIDFEKAFDSLSWSFMREVLTLVPLLSSGYQLSIKLE